MTITASGILRTLTLAFFVHAPLHAQIVREDFKEGEAHVPIVNADLTSPFLELRRIGQGADQLKLSHHPEIENDPYYLWNGQSKGPVLAAFHFKKRLDLSDPKWVCRLRTKNVGDSRLHIAIKVDGHWLVQKNTVLNNPRWNVQSIPFSGQEWKKLSARTALPGNPVPAPKLTKVEGIGFAAPVKPNGSKSCIRLDWFEITGSAPDWHPRPEQLPRPPRPSRPSRPTGNPQFLEPGAPFLRSALLIKDGKEPNRVRRGVLVPLGNNHWACFDPDLLRWAAFWRAPYNQAPLTYDSMAAISYPQGTTKAKAPPSVRGQVLYQNPERPGVGSTKDSRPTLVNDKSTKIGPLPVKHGRWLGLTLHGKIPVLQYLAGSTRIREFATMTPTLQRVMEVEPHQRDISLNVGSQFKFVHGDGASLSKGKLRLTRTRKTRVIIIGTNPVSPCEFPQAAPALPIDRFYLTAQNPPARIQGSFSVRPIAIPSSTRYIRPTDIAFLSDGTGLLSTLDGDIWKIHGIESARSSWTRIATGLFESISIETTPDNRIFVLGRDQVTELIDHTGDGIIEEYRNASDAFHQTLHTRDYATSLAIQKDGSFLVAKGGIQSDKSNPNDELSEHRGSIVQLNADGTKAKVLADGLRLPYVGLRNDGAVFASDQQGNYVPSTPLHLISKNRSFLGHQPTNFKGIKDQTEPLLWYPYQANRSGAAFTTTSRKAFPDLGDSFLQISWGGRLFAIETPKQGQPFSWQLPVQLDFPSLNGSSHPRSGRLYVTGLGISGYKPTTPLLSGLASVEQYAPLPSPVAMDVQSDHIRIFFNRPLTREESIIPASPALRMFNIKRSAQYGSGHYQWNATPGEHHFQPTGFRISSDRRSLLLTFDSLYRCDVLDLSLTVNSGPRIFPLHLFSRPDHLPEVDRRALEKLAELEKKRAPLQRGDVHRGRMAFTNFACAGCHSLDDTQLVGPSLKGLANRFGTAAIKQSILEPNAVITPGYPAAMPSFSGVIPDQELADLLAFLNTLRR